jgi:hypothetical protein
MSTPVTGIQDYIDQHNLQKQVEEVLNGTVKSKPVEPLSFMVGMFIALKFSYQMGQVSAAFNALVCSQQPQTLT